MTAQAVKISRIAERLKEDIPLKHTHERLDRHLRKFKHQETIHEDAVKIAAKKCRKDTLLLIDGGDIAKP